MGYCPDVTVKRRRGAYAINYAECRTRKIGVVAMGICVCFMFISARGMKLALKA